MENIYNSDSAKNFNDKFKERYDLLDSGLEAISKTEAQKWFREVLNTSVIPEPIYNDNKEIIDSAIQTMKSSKNKIERLKSIKTINDYSISLPTYKTRGNLSEKLPIEKKYLKKELFVIRGEYNSEIGLIFSKELESLSVFM